MPVLWLKGGTRDDTRDRVQVLSAELQEVNQDITEHESTFDSIPDDEKKTACNCLLELKT